MKKVIMLTEVIASTVDLLWGKTHSHSIDTMRRLWPRRRRMGGRRRDRVGPRMGVEGKKIKRHIGLHHLHIDCSHVEINERYVEADQPKIGRSSRRVEYEGKRGTC